MFMKEQITISGNNCKYVSYTDVKYTTTYAKEYLYDGEVLLKSGDTVVQESKSVITANTYDSNVKLKAQSIEGYLLDTRI